VKPRARSRVRGALAGCALALAGGCSEGLPPPTVDLIIRARWNDTPASVGEIGYELETELFMYERAASCVPLSDLRVTVNDAQYSTTAGNCDLSVVVTAVAVRPDVDTVVTLQSNYGVMGTATFRGLFPGAGGAHLVSPADGRVRMGETFAISIPTAWPVGDGRVSAYVQWLDPAPEVPPFHSYVVGNATADGTAVELAAPMLTGRAQVILENLYPPVDPVAAESCSGFDSCSAFATSALLGPVAIEVIP
jgi:hypothetical protein